ncbi:hemolysin secretion protein D [Defluviimonas sp. 20V17]|uniref:Hemolysin secretion protein D n=1 Tax=Allgaiera indica TaxID=765699 RepID=A0AAN4UP87_9RHOB|nr:HlyD family efflux transporter periplasmic adaptor subunit [Allgaiera indica]KDB04308.1 hemolysin secretion protein D [Defluviimonas sp. 20V17]GHD99553.1 hemolysin secretion protein D [Allgaiera indica]SDW23169.1 HlyD family secretion protein [Allgaiera indica]
MILCSVPVLSAFLSACAAPPPLATGYVEGDYVLVAPVAVAQVEALKVRRGQHVKAGAVLAVTEHRDAEIALAQATAALAQAQSQLANLQEGRRPQEIAVIAATLASAEAQANEASKEVARLSSLNDRGVTSQAQLDGATTQLEVARAQVAQAKANLAVARLPARPKQIEAAEAAVAQARARRDAAAWQLSQRTLLAPRAGTVFDILRRAGEIAGPQAPVISFLPDGAVKLKLYFPETAFARIHPGAVLNVHCDGCGRGEKAKVTYVSDSPEFTPPVIYSLQNRQKLVYLVEAKPEPGAVLLKPGQIVDVDLPGADK